MSIDFNNPVKTQNYDTGMLASLRAHQIALAQWLDPASAGTLSNVPTGAYQLDGGALKRYNGTSWAAQAINGINWDGTRVIVGSATALVFAGITPFSQVQAPHSGASSGIARFSAGVSGAGLYLGHSRGTTLGVHAPLQASDELGVVSFVGSDGTDLLDGARIRAIVDGSVAAGELPVRLDFYTRAAGGGASTLALSLKGDNTAQFSGPARVNGAIYGTLGTRQTGAYGGSGANTGRDDIVVENSGNAGLTFLTPNTMTAAVQFGDPENNAVGGVIYNHATNTMSLVAGGSTIMTFSAAGSAATGTLSGAAITHLSGYLRMYPYSATYDDGSNMRVYWNGNTGNLVFDRDGGTGTAGVRLQCDVVGDVTGTGTLAAGSTVGGQAIGYLGLPTIAHQATAAATAKGKCILATGNVTINSGVFSDGDSIVIANTLGTPISIVDGTIATMRLSGTTTTGTRTLGPYGEAVLHFIGTEVRVSGSGVS